MSKKKESLSKKQIAVLVAAGFLAGTILIPIVIIILVGLGGL